MDPRRGWLEFLALPFPRHELARLAASISHPGDLLALDDAELSRRFGLASEAIARLRRRPTAATIDRQLALLDRHGIDLLPVGDPRFPRNLFAMRVPPPALFVKGRLEDVDALAVALVGPRRPTSYGLQVTTALARDLAPMLTIISGAALGIDTRAHQTALDHGGRTIAVLGCGIDIDYPVGNRPLRERIAAGEAGALVSVFPPGSAPLRGNFPARNFILAGLALAVVVVEASPTSGALVTARAAGEEGRPVYAVPGDIHRLNSQGSNALLRDGAIALSGAGDLLQDLEGMLAGELLALRQRRQPTAGTPAAPRADVAESPLHRLLLELLGQEPLDHDTLIARLVPATASLGDLATALLELELDGAINQLPGRVYTRAL
jgi:DNA processing protein